ncbi:MAG: hypothetical protein P1S59_08430 [bacterium]|nr:hypothetical protein [bacterium]
MRLKPVLHSLFGFGATLMMVAAGILATPAGVFAWTSAGPWGGVIHALENSPAEGNTIYAGTGNGIYLRNVTDAGGAWQPFENTLGYRVLQLLPDPANDVVYAVVRGSRDDFNFDDTMWSGYLYELNMTSGTFESLFGVDDPATAGTDETREVSSMVLCGPGDLLVTTHDEELCTEFINAQGECVNSSGNAVSPMQVGYVYRRAASGGAFSSGIDPGWYPFNLPIQSALGSAGSNTVYLVRSNDDGSYSDMVVSDATGSCGTTWRAELDMNKMGTLTEGEKPISLGYSLAGHVLFGTRGGKVFRKSDAGSWAAHGTGLPTSFPVVDFGIDIQGRMVSILRKHGYVGSNADDPNGGVWYLDDATWRPSSVYNYVSSRVRAVLPLGGDEWVAYDQAGIWRYMGGQGAAVEDDRGIAAVSLDGMVINPRHQDRALAFGASGLYERIDGDWSRVILSYIRFVSNHADSNLDVMQDIRDKGYISAEFSFDDTGTIWVGGKAGVGLLKGVVRTQDPVSYWFDQVFWDINTKSTITDLLVDPFDLDTIWFTNVSKDGIYRSIDGGGNFASMTTHLSTARHYRANLLVSDLLEPEQRSILVGTDSIQDIVPGVLFLEGSGAFEETGLYMNQSVGGLDFNPAELGTKKAVAGAKNCVSGMALTRSNDTWVLDTAVPNPDGLPQSQIIKALEIPHGADADGLADAFTVAHQNGTSFMGLYHSRAGTYQGSPGAQWDRLDGEIDLYGPTSVTVHPKDGNLLWVTTQCGSAFTLRNDHFNDMAGPLFPWGSELEILNTADVLAGMAGTMELSWMAPGDDGDMPGWADRYVLYYRTDRAFAGTRDLADVGVVSVNGMPAPHISHRVETYSLDISSYTDTRFFLALAAYDEQDQVSALLTAATNPLAAGTEDPPPVTSGGGGGGGCFIATAAYGSPMEAEVDLLREYRDNYLVHRGWGRVLLAVYYTVSPKPADFIARHPLLKQGARIMLSPIIGTVRSGAHTGALPVVVGFMLVLIPLAGGLVLLSAVFRGLRKTWILILLRSHARQE